MVIIAISLICALLGFYIGWKRRARPLYCFLIGLLLGPIAIPFWFFITPPNRDKKEE